LCWGGREEGDGEGVVGCWGDDGWGCGMWGGEGSSVLGTGSEVCAWGEVVWEGLPGGSGTCCRSWERAEEEEECGELSTWSVASCSGGLAAGGA